MHSVAAIDPCLVETILRTNRWIAYGEMNCLDADQLWLPFRQCVASEWAAAGLESFVIIAFAVGLS